MVWIAQNGVQRENEWGLWQMTRNPARKILRKQNPKQCMKGVRLNFIQPFLSKFNPPLSQLFTQPLHKHLFVSVFFSNATSLEIYLSHSITLSLGRHVSFSPLAYHTRPPSTLNLTLSITSSLILSAYKKTGSKKQTEAYSLNFCP